VLNDATTFPLSASIQSALVEPLSAIKIILSFEVECENTFYFVNNSFEKIKSHTAVCSDGIILLLVKLPVMRSFKKYLLVIFFLAPVISAGQILDTINASFHHKPKLFLSLIGFTSFINEDLAAFSGFRFGLSYNKKVRIGIGLAGMNSRIVRQIKVDTDSGVYVTNGNLRFGYFETSFEYIFFKKYPWQFSVPLELGIGTAYYEYVETKDSAYAHTPSNTIVIFHPEVKAQYSFFRWAGIGSSLGYRISLYSPDKLNENFSSITFSLGLQLYLDEIYNMVFPRGIGGKKIPKE
jgi:hypothetical protein